LPRGDAWQNNVTDPLLGEQQIDKFIDVMHDKVSTTLAEAHTSVVVEKRLEVLVDVECGANQTQIEGGQKTHVPIVLVLEKLEHDLALGLNGKHLEQQTEKIGWQVVAPVRASVVVQLHRLVHQGFGVQRKAVFLPVERVPDAHAKNLLHQELWIHAVHIPRLYIRAVGHGSRLWVE